MHPNRPVCGATDLALNPQIHLVDSLGVGQLGPDKLAASVVGDDQLSAGDTGGQFVEHLATYFDSASCGLVGHLKISD